MKKLLAIILLLLPTCMFAQNLESKKSLVFVKMLDEDKTVLDNNGNPCAKIVIETALKDVDIVGGYILSEIVNTDSGYEFFVSVPKRQGQYITMFHDEFNSLSIPLWLDSPLKGGAEYVLTLKGGASISMKGLYGNSDAETIDLSSLNTSIANDMSGMFDDCQSLKSLDLSNFNTSNVTNMSDMFSDCDSLTSLNLSNFNTSNVTDMSGMFAGCENLTSLDLSNFNTSNVTNMSSMFDRCESLTSLDLSNFNTSNVTNMSRMFSDCDSLTSLNLSNFNTSNVTDMSEMFDGCENLTSLDLSNFNTSNVTDMSKMFDGCENLISLDLSSFNTANVTRMCYMFAGCKNLVTLDISNFNMIVDEEEIHEFYKCNILETMFRECNKLKTIKVTNCNQQTIEKLRFALREAGIEKQVRFIY